MTPTVSLIRIDIEITRPWAIGGVAEGGDDVALPILSDPRTTDLPYLPATSLVGSLRHHLGSVAVDWLGPDATDGRGADSQNTPDGDGGKASPIRCLGTRLVGSLTVETRRTTAIDPERAAALAHDLRAEHIVHATGQEPTTVHWWLQVDQPVDHELGHLLTALATWRPFVGRRRSAGQGDGAVSSIFSTSLDLEDADDLHWWLVARHAWDGMSDEASPPRWTPFSPQEPDTDRGSGEVISTTFVVVEPLFIGSDSVIKEDTDGEIKVSLDRIPGSSWKGLFRHRVEHILRVSGADFVQGRVVGALFGTGRGPAASADSGERGVLRFHSSEIAGDARTVTRTHIAIDRVTSGVRDRSGQPAGTGKGGALFSVRAYAPGTSVDLIIESTRPLADQERNLLWHVIRDLETGIVGVGGMTSRGYGTLRAAGDPAHPVPVVASSFDPGPTVARGQTQAPTLVTAPGAH